MELFRIIKSDAKRALRFCGGRTVAAMFAVVLALLAVNVTESVLLLVLAGPEAIYSDLASLAESNRAVIPVLGGSCVLWLLLVPAMIVGYIKLHLSFAEGSDESVLMVFERFSSFKKYFGSIFFAIGFAVRYLFVFAIAVLPGGAFLWFSETYIPEGNRTAELLKISACSIAVIIMVLCVFLGVIFVQRWSLAVYYFALGEGIGKSFSLSAKAAKGMHTEILSFKFSFIGWGILSVFILPLVWTVPYYETANAIFAKYLMERYERSLAEVPEIDENVFTFEEG
ncbi:MAG: DUF975 family protein [Oscillospiraceae bacterium]|nr:DUF975 family protein [Oscillospiraceae bacterium]